MAILHNANGEVKGVPGAQKKGIQLNEVPVSRQGDNKRKYMVYMVLNEGSKSAM